MNEFNGIAGIVKKVLLYNQIDYSKVYKIIEEYSEKPENESRIKR